MDSLLYLVSAFGLGALHALEPGHGKAMVAAYLLGSRGRPQDAILLGLVVTLTHTMSIWLLAALMLTVATFLVPEQVERQMEVLSGLLVLGVGLWLFWQRVLGGRLPGHAHHHHDHAHEHGHAHHHHDHEHHGHGHSHHHHDHEHHHGHAHGELPRDAQGRLDLRGLIVLGISGGIVPCPGALAMLLTAVAAGGLGSVVAGLGGVVAFSLGLASVLVGLGLALVLSTDWASRRFSWSEKLAPIANQASAWLVLGLGIYLTVRPLIEV